jgi:Ni,Fe-hydrogenase III component G
MSNEQDVKKQLEDRFSFLKSAVTAPRARRIFVEVPLDHFSEVLEHAIKGMHFLFLSAVTGLDEGATLGVIYALSSKNGDVLNLRIHLDRSNPKVETITSYFPSADIYERELVDLLGIQVTGLGPGPRYPLPDNWPKGQYPLRKDWMPESTGEKEVVPNA